MSDADRGNSNSDGHLGPRQSDSDPKRPLRNLNFHLDNEESKKASKKPKLTEKTGEEDFFLPIAHPLSPTALNAFRTAASRHIQARLSQGCSNSKAFLSSLQALRRTERVKILHSDHHAARLLLRGIQPHVLGSAFIIRNELFRLRQQGYPLERAVQVLTKRIESTDLESPFDCTPPDFDELFVVDPTSPHAPSPTTSSSHSSPIKSFPPNHKTLPSFASSSLSQSHISSSQHRRSLPSNRRPTATAASAASAAANTSDTRDNATSTSFYDHDNVRSLMTDEESEPTDWSGSEPATSQPALLLAMEMIYDYQPDESQGLAGDSAESRLRKRLSTFSKEEVLKLRDALAELGDQLDVARHKRSRPEPNSDDEEDEWSYENVVAGKRPMRTMLPDSSEEE